MLQQCDKSKQFVLTTWNLLLVADVRIFLQHLLQSGCTDKSDGSVYQRASAQSLFQTMEAALITEF